MVAQVRRLPISQRGVDAQTRLHGAGAERRAVRNGCPEGNQKRVSQAS